MQQFTIEERETAITYSLNNRFERIMKDTMVFNSHRIISQIHLEIL